MDRANSSRAVGGADSAVSGPTAGDFDDTGETGVNTGANASGDENGTAAADTETTTTSADAAPMAKDDLFHVLQNQRRRRVLAYLRGATGPVDMRDIAELIAARENGKSVAAISSDERQRAYIALYQSHLPKLDEMGVVRYQQDRGIVERTELADQFDPYLDVDSAATTTTTTTDDDPRPGRTVRYYGGATLLGAAISLASWVGALPALSPAALATAVVSLFVLVTGLVVWGRRR
ncbi:hypothetical protein ACFO0N_11580 [Halobium salinum]|uniref:DUF7344 domain-containing protein n=1 Tax=Halobium salinum TaxID=1364940 RepID=A0ABD5PDP2_9EURY|nr:hypothetical protein [Halobium salinum]